MFPLHRYSPTPATISLLAGPAREEPLSEGVCEASMNRAAGNSVSCTWKALDPGAGRMIQEATLTKCELEKPQGKTRTEVSRSRTGTWERPR